jgi:hypothetical protein
MGQGGDCGRYSAGRGLGGGNAYRLDRARLPQICLSIRIGAARSHIGDGLRALLARMLLAWDRVQIQLMGEVWLHAKGWMRLVVGLSVIWMIGGTVFIAGRLTDDATEYAESLRSICELGNKSLVRDFPIDGPKHTRDCGAEWQKHYGIGLDPFVKNYGQVGAAVYTLGVLLLGWILAGLTFLIIRWTRRGFNRSGRAGWYRVGILASVVWAIGGGIWGNSVGIAKAHWVIAAYKECLEQRSIQPDGSVPSDTDWTPCTLRFNRDYKAAVADHWLYAAMFGLVPILLGWLGVPLVNWIRAGFAVRAQTAQPGLKPD